MFRFEIYYKGVDKMYKTLLRLDPSLIEILKKESARQNRSLNNLITVILLNYFKQEA